MKESEEETDEEELGVLDWVFFFFLSRAFTDMYKRDPETIFPFFPPFCFLHSHPHSHLDNSPLIISGSSAHPPSFTSLMRPPPPVLLLLLTSSDRPPPHPSAAPIPSLLSSLTDPCSPPVTGRCVSTCQAP